MTRALAATAAALTVTACSYDFTNPAEQLTPGQVAGRVVADVSGTGSFSGLPGVSVALENSPFDQVTRETGRFTLLGLPAGRHTVVFRRGATWALQRDVEVGYGPDGRVEAVAIGDVRLRYTVTLQGTFTLPPDFSPAPATAVVEDEATGARAALSSTLVPGQIAYTLQGLPVGPHRVRFAVSGTRLDPLLGPVPASYLGGPLAIDVPESSEGQALTLNPVTLRATGTGTGRLQFKLAVVAPQPASPSAALVTLTPTPPLGDPVPDSTGFVDVDLPEGVYALDVLFVAGQPGPGQPAFIQPPPRRTFAVGADRITELGVLYGVDDLLASATSLACFDDADCAPGTCEAGTCVGWSPPPVAPAAVPFCAADDASCVSAACGPCAGGYGTCVPGASGNVCLPAGAPSCTPDGFSVVLDSCGRVP